MQYEGLILRRTYCKYISKFAYKLVAIYGGFMNTDFSTVNAFTNKVLFESQKIVYIHNS